jgi:glycosyltransferase involved in cell wall biosynthesis
LGLAYAVVLVLQRVFGEVEIPGWTSLLVAVLLIGGIQLITLGVMGEYIGRIYEEIQGRPLYLVENEIGFSEDRGTAA